MSLSFGNGSLAPTGDVETNHDMQAQPPRSLFHPYPRRMRAVVADRVILDSLRGHMLRESGSLPELYFPREDFDGDLLERSNTVTDCRARGRAGYWSVRVDGITLPDVVWSYEQPAPGHEWLRGQLAIDFDAPDMWLCEDERLFGHLRDPYHRVDVFESSREVTVRVGEQVIARSRRPRLLFETGLPVRAYLPASDVRAGLLWPSATRTICPYKGEAWHWTLRLDGGEVEDAAWSYETPLPEAFAIKGCLCFYDSKASVELAEPSNRFAL